MEETVPEPTPTPESSGNTGSTIRPELRITPEPGPLPLATDADTQRAALQNPAAQAAVDTLAKELAIDATRIAVVSVEEVEWPDGCLGVRIPGVLCMQVITPGFRVTLESAGQQYVYHADASGQQVILASRPR
jgi:hypothetical protein